MVQEILTCALAAALLPARAAGVLEEARKAHAAKDYVRALELARPQALRGDPEAMTLLGEMYHYGRGLPRDAERAWPLLSAAAGRGQPIAQFALATMYLGNEGRAVQRLARSRRIEEGVRWGLRSARQGYPYGELLIGTCHLKGAGLPKDYVQAERWLGKAARRGTLDASAKAQFLLGRMQENGWTGPADPEEALKWYLLSSAYGYPPAAREADRLTTRMSKAEIRSVRRRLEGFKRSGL